MVNNPYKLLEYGEKLGKIDLCSQANQYIRLDTETLIRLIQLLPRR
jgi:hypothetical protein